MIHLSSVKQIHFSILNIIWEGFSFHMSHFCQVRLLAVVSTKWISDKTFVRDCIASHFIQMVTDSAS